VKGAAGPVSGIYYANVDGKLVVSDQQAALGVVRGVGQVPLRQRPSSTRRRTHPGCPTRPGARST
jgi:hypothetical protein